MAETKTIEEESSSVVVEEIISRDDSTPTLPGEGVTPSAEETKDATEVAGLEPKSRRKGISANVTNTFVIVLVIGVVLSITFGFFLGKFGFEFLISQGVFK